MSRYYMGAITLNHAKNNCGFPVYESLEDAIEAASNVVAKSGETRYIVKTVAKIEPLPPPVRVTLEP